LSFVFVAERPTSFLAKDGTRWNPLAGRAGFGNTMVLALPRLRAKSEMSLRGNGDLHILGIEKTLEGSTDVRLRNRLREDRFSDPTFPSC
jgi:hypothetical protein